MNSETESDSLIGGGVIYYIERGMTRKGSAALKERS